MIVADDTLSEADLAALKVLDLMYRRIAMRDILHKDLERHYDGAE